MTRLGDLYARPRLEAPPLAPELAAALAAAPDPVARDLEALRAATLAEPTDLGARLRRVEADAAAGLLAPMATIELWAWVGYLAIVRGYRSTTTVAGYVRNVAGFLAWAHAERRDYANLDLSAFDAWSKSLYLTRKHGARWRSRQAAAVRSFYDWRCTRGIGPNCAAGLRSPRTPASVPRKYSIAQLQGMLAATKDRRHDALKVRDRTILLLLLSTGMRREEISNLNLGDLELGKTVGVVRIHGKGAKQREVSFEGPVVDALREWLMVRDNLAVTVEPEAVFVSVAARAPGHRLSVDSFEQIVTRTAKAAGVRDWGVHRFRITFATAMYDAGHGIEEIRILLGHENIETTRRYLAVSERARRTRLSSTIQHQVLGTRGSGRPRWVNAALGGARE